MNGEKQLMDNESFLHMIQTEFLINTAGWTQTELRRAEYAITTYDSVEDFLEQSGWGRDNPELQDEQYLTENRICRWVDEKFIYFSRLAWESELEEQRL